MITDVLRSLSVWLKGNGFEGMTFGVSAFDSLKRQLENEVGRANLDVEADRIRIGNLVLIRSDSPFCSSHGNPSRNLEKKLDSFIEAIRRKGYARSEQ